MNVMEIPGPADIIEAWWTEVCKKIKNAVVFIDDFVVESLHWSGGQDQLLKAGALEVKEFSSFEKCAENDIKAVFLISDPIWETSMNIIKDIVSSSHLHYVIVITGAHPSIHSYCLHGGREENEGRIMDQLENDILSWMGNMNYTAEIFYYPIFGLSVTDKLFLLPKFREIYPLLSADLSSLSYTQNPFSKSEAKDIVALSDVEFANLPRKLKIAIRHLISVIHSLFQGMDAREEIFYLGHTAQIVASELESYGPAKHRRKTASKKVSLVLVDRTLDLVHATSHNSKCLLNQILTYLPRLPGHVVDSAINMNSLCGLHPSCEWTLLPGCLAHPSDVDAKALLRDIVHSPKSDVIDMMRQKVKNKNQNSNNDSRGNGIKSQDLEQSIIHLASDTDQLLSNFGLIQQSLAVCQAVNHPRNSSMDEIRCLEKKFLQTASEVEDKDNYSLNEILQLIPNRSALKLTVEDILGLLAHVASLGTVVTEEAEYGFINTLSQALLEDKHLLSESMQDIIGEEVDEVSALKASTSIWNKLLSLSTSRNHLKDYSQLYGRRSDIEPYFYESLLQRLVRDCLSSSSSSAPTQLNDLECKSTGFKNMIKTGFSLFVNVSKPMPRDAASVIFYIIGGISALEVQELTKVAEDCKNLSCDVFFASSHLTYPSDAVNLAFKTNPLFGQL